MPAKELSAEQKRDAERLKSLFKSWQSASPDGIPISQERACEQIGLSQSAISQYLNGRIPLNPKAAVKFAKAIGADVSAFSETIAREIKALSTSAGDQVLSEMPKALHQTRPVRPWPFETIDQNKVLALNSDHLEKLELAMWAAAGAMGIDIAAKRVGKRKAA